MLCNKASNNLSTQDIIGEIYKVIKESELGKDIHEVVDGRKLDLLNVLANPKRESIFKAVEDFENKVLIDVRRLLSEENALNEYDREFTLNQCIIDFYYSIHNIKVDKDIALFFSLGSHYKKLSSSNKTVKREVSEICEDPLIESYIMLLASSLQRIELSSRDGTIEYTIDHEDVDRQERALKMDGLIYPKNTKNTLEQLLKNQNSDEFEQLVTSPKNIYYSVPQEENKCRPNFIVSKKNHKNTVCKLILGMFVLSVGLYVADYFLMEQKLFNPIKGVLPQDNFANLVIAAMLTIVIVYALSQLLKPPQEPPLSTVDDVRKKKLEPLHANKLRTT